MPSSRLLQNKSIRLEYGRLWECMEKGACAVVKGFAFLLQTGPAPFCHSSIDLLQTISIDVVYPFDHYYYFYF